MDIRSGAGYPASALTNFAPHRFVIDGIVCASMEGFLQSLKFKSIPMQAHICTLVGKAAKMAGKGKNWHRTQTLWWKGQAINRHSPEYQRLIDWAYEELTSQCEGFRKALLATGDAVIKHSIGRSNPSETVLTEREYCSRLMKLRDRVRAGEFDPPGQNTD